VVAVFDDEIMKHHDPAGSSIRAKAVARALARLGTSVEAKLNQDERAMAPIRSNSRGDAAWPERRCRRTRQVPCRSGMSRIVTNLWPGYVAGSIKVT